MKKRLKTITYNLENSFYLHVIRHGLAMMIPILLTGGIANALMNLPIQAYQRIIENSFFAFFFAYCLRWYIWLFFGYHAYCT